IYETERIFNAPLESLRAFIEDGNKIIAAMEETDNIKKPVDTVVVHGIWPEEGAVRRLEFSDGHYTLERVLENDHPTLFRYQVWDFTAAAGNNLDYAVGQQAWEARPDGTSKLTWTYSLKPNAGYKRFFVQRFVNNDMRPLMDNALDVVKAQADEAFSDTDS
ncbi:MAG: SRPBCC family protein, partial [Pseudomonadota bacterium]